MIPEPTTLHIMTWASWGSVFAGAVAAMALSVVMALLGVALGFTVIAPKSDDPTAGLGMAFGFWSCFSAVVSIGGGGFVAGLFAGQRGLEHGFLVWSVITIAGTAFSGFAVGSAVKILGSAIRMLGSGAAGIAGSVGKGAANAASGVIEELRDRVNLNLDPDGIGDSLKSVLRDTGVDTLQPEYLQEQMREARSELRAALYQLSLTPSDSDRIISGFLETQKTRLESLTRDIDREAAVKALMYKRDIPKEDAEKMVDNALEAYERVLHKAREILAEARAQVRDAREYLKGLAQTAREKADRFAAGAARAALAGAAVLVLTAAVSMGAGLCGSGVAPTWEVVQKTYFVG